MSSSISSFKKTEWKVIVAVILGVLVLEVVARIIAPFLDYNREHIHAFPEIVENMARDEEPQVMIFGNSLLMHGVDEGLLDDEISRATSSSCSVTKITPVSTAIRDWNYLYDTYFTEKNIHPDAVVVGFVGHHIPDQYELKLRRLTHHFCSSNNLGECLENEAPTFDLKALGAISHVSALYGDQEEHQWGVSAFFISNYGSGVNKINNILDAQDERVALEEAAKSSDAGPPPNTYKRLARLIETFKKHNVRAYFVPMPQPELWDLDPAAVETIESNGATLIDARAIAGMTEGDFSDGYHLGKTGTEKFTRFLAQVIAADLQR